MSIVEQIPQTIMRGGQIVAAGGERLAEIQARQQEQNGQLWGNLIGHLGQLPQQYQQAKLAETKRKFDDLQIKQKTSEIQDEQDINKALDGWKPTADGVVSPDRSALAAGFTAQGKAHLIPKMNEILDKADHSTAQAQKAQGEVADHTANALGALGAGVHEHGNTVDALGEAAKYAVTNKLLTQQQVQPYLDKATQDPSAVSQITAGLMASSKDYKEYLSQETARKALEDQRTEAAAARLADTNRKAQDDADKREEKATANAATQLAAAKTADDYARRYKGLPAAIQAKFDPPEAFDAKTSGQRARFVAMTPEQQQKALHDEVTEQNAAAARATADLRAHSDAVRADATAAREGRLERQGDPSVKAATLAQKAQAERWKAEELAKAEKWFSDPTQLVTKKVTDGHGNTSDVEDPAGRYQKLGAMKAQIQDSYLAQIGLQPAGKAGAVPAAAPVAKAAPGTPKEGTEGAVNGVPAIWKTVNGKTGWYAKAK